MIIVKNKFKDYGINLAAIIISYLVFIVVIKTGLINGYMQSVMAYAFIHIIVAISLNIATGYLGQLALGHAGMMAAGAYGAGLFAKAVEFPVIIEVITSLFVGGLVAGIFGLIIGIPALRLRGDYLGIVTLGFGEMIRYTIINLKDLTGGAAGLKNIPAYLKLEWIVLILILVVSFTFLFIRSRHGRAMISIRENEIAAEAVGVPTTFYKVYGFFISSFIAGIGGACFALTQGYLSVESFKFMFSVELLIIVVFGGMGSITGTIIAGSFLAMLTQFLYDYDELRLIIYALLLIVLMIFKPDGIFGRHEFSLVQTPERLRAFRDKMKKKFGKEVA